MEKDCVWVDEEEKNQIMLLVRNERERDRETEIVKEEGEWDAR